MTKPRPDELQPRSSWHRSDSLAKLEAFVVLTASPILFFPTLSLPATFLALVAIAIVWLLPLLLRREPGIPVTIFNVSLIPWGLVLIIAILVSADPDQTLPKATGIILGLAVWRLLVLFARTRSEVGLGFIGFVLVGTILTVIGSLGLQEIPKIPVLAPFSLARFFSLSERFGLAIHPNQLAGLICLFFPLLVSLLVGWRPKLGHKTVLRGALALITAVVGAVLLLTQSRGGWLGVIGGLMVLLASWAIQMPPSGTRTVVRSALVGLTALGLITLIAIGPQRLQQLWLDPPTDTAVGTFSTLNYRKELWPWALTAVDDFAFTGTGLGTFREVAFRLYPVQLSPNADIGHAHNIFLQTALDVGLPGLVIYLTLLLVAAGGAWSVASVDTGYRPFGLGLLAGLAALHIYGLADALALGSKPSLLFWFALGLIAVMRQTAVGRATDQDV